MRTGGAVYPQLLGGCTQGIWFLDYDSVSFGARQPARAACGVCRLVPTPPPRLVFVPAASWEVPLACSEGYLSCVRGGSLCVFGEILPSVGGWQ